MKKIILTLSAIIILSLLIVGCNNVSKVNNSLEVYSFSGEDEQLSVSNGVIVLSDTEEIYYGGTLAMKQGEFSNLAEITHTIYKLNGDAKNTILSMSSADITGSGLNFLTDDIGKVSKAVSTNKKETNFKDNLYYELKTINSLGEENIYQLKLTIIEITDKES